MVGKLTHWLLLHRPALALFNAVYAFCHTDSPERPRRLWPSVQQELNDAVAVLPLVRSDLSRQDACLDACDTGAAVVYTGEDYFHDFSHFKTTIDLLFTLRGRQLPFYRFRPS